MRLRRRHRIGRPPNAPASAPKNSKGPNHENMGDPAALPNTQTPKHLRAQDKEDEFVGRRCTSCCEVATLDYVATLDSKKQPP